MTAREFIGLTCRTVLLSVITLSAGSKGVHGHEGHDLGIDVQVPLVLSPEARAGEKHYEVKCVSCHGKNAEGTHSGPSLIPYDKAHHPDRDFAKAIRLGVPGHHWNFGDMPPIEDLTEEEIRNIIIYVRELQAFNAEENHRNSNRR